MKGAVCVTVPSDRTVGIELRPAEPPRPRCWWGECRGGGAVLNGYPRVTDVARDSAAYLAGMRAGCTLVSLNGHSMRSKDGATIRKDFEREKRATTALTLTFVPTTAALGSHRTD